MSVEDWLPLVLAPGLNPARVTALLHQFGDDPSALHQARRRTLTQAGLQPATIDALQNPDKDTLQRALRWLEPANHHLIHCQDPRFPSTLHSSGHAPTALFVAGDPDTLALPQLAVVGSRNATAGGLATAHDFAAHLTGFGLTITSGLAAGIDAAAHTGALDAGGLTVAVLGTGPDIVYPRSNIELARRIVASGAIISEFAPGMPARREQFPQRNRIIAALSLGTLVVEATSRSGSLITARYAGDYGREVFAIPGSIHNPLSKGCHQLIRQGAKLVETAADIVEEIGHAAQTQFAAATVGDLEPAAPGAQPAAHKPPQLDEDYVQLLKQLAFDPVSVEALATRSGLTAEQLSSMLLILELQGRVVALPGGRFQQCTHVDPAHE